MSGKRGWKCGQCTFEHQFPGTRCVMCQRLRTTNEQLIDFVNGVPIPESSKINTSTVGTHGHVEPLVPAAAAAATAPNNKTQESTSNPATTSQRKEEAPTAQQPPNAIRKQPQNVFYRQPQKSTNDAESSSSAAAGTSTKTKDSSVPNPHAAASGTPHQGAAAASSTTNTNGTASANPRRDNPESASNAATPHPKNHDRSTEENQPPFHNNDANTNHQATAANPYRTNSVVTNDNNKNQSAMQPKRKQANGPSATAATNNNKRRAASTNPQITRKPNHQQAFKGIRGQSKARVALPYVPGPVPLDESTLAEWIFPIHEKYSKRKYQQEMAESAIFDNTLVSLPTGLGKTMIAAVVMYNYYRWFPTGKLIFCAPTLPLVYQQVKAIYDIVGIPQSDIAVLTGKIDSTDREALWKSKRVFFCTPQTVQNDLNNESSNIPFSDVVCLVLDEVHKASGDHAYVKVAQLLRETQAKFRLVGLSATPGADQKAVQEVIKVLGISRIDCRFDDDPDIKPHTHNREDEIVIVQETDLASEIGHKCHGVMRECLLYLQKHGFLSKAGSGAAIAPFTVIKASQQYNEEKTRKDPNVHPNLYPYFEVVRMMVDFRHSIVTYGIGVLRQKLRTFDVKIGKRGAVAIMAESEDFLALRNLIITSTENSQGNADVERLLSENPKLVKLKEVLNEHFLRAKALKDNHREQGDASGGRLDRDSEEGAGKLSPPSTRAIVFSQFRDSVAEIVSALEPSRPLIRPARFVGQGKGSKSKDKGGEKAAQGQKGMKQAEQESVIEDFRNGGLNVLVCTSIGEEGLDVGQCDLIVNFDNLQSATRMIQRTGRTGRSRDGRVVFLLTAPEKKKYLTAKSREKTLLRSLKDPNKFAFHPNHSMFPSDRPLPALCEKEGLRNDADFRLSQVGGNAGPGKRKRKSVDRAGGNKRKSHEESGRWKLTDQEEMLRNELLGSEIDKGCTTGKSGFPLPLRKRFLKAREMSYSAQTPVDLSRYQLGSTLAIVRTIQEMHGDRYDPCKISVPRSFMREKKAVQSLFPFKEDMPTPLAISVVAVAAESTTTTAAAALEDAAKDRSRDIGPRPSSNAGQATRETEVQSVLPQATRAHVVEPPQSTEPRVCANMEQNMPRANMEQNKPQQTHAVAPLSSSNALTRHAPEASIAKTMPSCNPYKKAPAARDINNAPVTTVGTNPYTATAARVGQGVIPSAAKATQGHSLPPIGKSSSACNRPNSTLVISAERGAVEQISNNLVSARDQSHSSVGIATAAGETKGSESHYQNDVTRAESAVADSNEKVATEETAENQANGKDNVEFYLPTPPDSSSSEDEDESDDDCPSDGEAQKDSTALTARATDNEQHLASSGNNNKAPGELPGDEYAELDKGALSHMEPSEAPDAARIVIENLTHMQDLANYRATPSIALGKDRDSDSVHASQSFRLPTQSDSSSSSSEDESDDGSAGGKEQANGQQATENATGAQKSTSSDTAAASDMNADASDDEFEGDDDEDDIPLVSLRNKDCGGSEQTSPEQDPGSIREDSSHYADSGVVVVHRRKHQSKKLVDPFLTQVELPSSNIKTPRHNRSGELHSTRGGLLDTPLQLTDTPNARAGTKTTLQDLADTPPTANSQLVDEVDNACVICLSKECHDDDQIVLCDGFGGAPCKLAFHPSCYSIDPKDLDDDDVQWRCDPCKLQHKIHVTKKVVNRNIQCFVCQKSDGPLKRASDNIWNHPYCVQWQTHSGDEEVCGICLVVGAVRCGKEGCKVAAHPHCAVLSIASSKPGASWTLLRVDFSPSGSVVEEKENGQALMFCPRDTEEARSFLQSLATGMGRRKVLAIPPDSLIVRKQVGGQGEGRSTRRLKKLAVTKPKGSPRKQRKGEEEVIDVDDSEEMQPADTEEARQARKRGRLERHKRARRFIDEEAGLGSDDDSEGDEAEERDLAALEAEELSMNSFINDSSQMGYTQDELGRVDPDATAPAAASSNDHDDALHRRVDNARARRNQYATPLLNRKMTRNSLTPSNAPESERGLGKMHFVRSVLEHHRNGGDADEIERAYNQLEQEEAEVLGDDGDHDSHVAFDYG